jgi:hypothetical protein
MIDVMTKDKFSLIVEEMVRDLNISYIDAIVHWCEQNEMEIETAAKLVSPLIKEKMMRECIDLNIIKGGARLPI